MPGKRTDIPLLVLIARYEEGESASSLANYYKCSVWSIIDRLNKSDIRVRSSKEQNEKRLNLLPEEKERFIELIDGLMLGDGSINFKNTLYLSQTICREQWVYHVYGLLSEMGVFTRLLFYDSREHTLEGRHIVEKPGVLLWSPAYVEMAEQRTRWYPKGNKVVPKDVRITPLSVAHWFAGDGTSGPSGDLTFCTNGFHETITLRLAKALSDVVGIKATARPTHRTGQSVIRVLRKDDSVKLRDFMMPYLSTCIHYKLRNVRPTIKALAEQGGQ